MRIYHQSAWFWIQRIFSILLFGSVFAGAFESKIGGVVALLFLIPLFSFLLYALLAIQPLAVEIRPDSFVVRFLWKHRHYQFADVSYITRDEVQFEKSGCVQSVKVGFHSRNSLQLAFPGVREKLYRDLITSWNASTDPKAEQ